MRTGETRRFEIAVAGLLQDLLSVFVRWPGSDVELTLTRAEREDLPPDHDRARRCRPSPRPDVEGFQVPDPEPGLWVVTLYSADLGADGKPVTVSTNVAQSVHRAGAIARSRPAAVAPAHCIVGHDVGPGHPIGTPGKPAHVMPRAPPARPTRMPGLRLSPARSACPISRPAGGSPKCRGYPASGLASLRPRSRCLEPHRSWTPSCRRHRAPAERPRAAVGGCVAGRHRTSVGSTRANAG